MLKNRFQLGQLMKRYATFGIAVIFFTFTDSRVVVADVSGLWTGTATGPCLRDPARICNDGVLVSYLFSQRGKKLTGVISSISKYRASLGQKPTPIQIENGSVMGKNITFSWRTRGMNLIWTSTGRIDGDEITLSDSVVGGYTPPANARPYRIRRQR